MRLKVSNVCQVFNKEEFIATTTKNGITFTNNGDGSFTINGTATANVFLALFKQGVEITGFNINHKYLICGNLSNTIQIFETLSGNNARYYEDSIFTCVKSKGYLDLRIIVGTTATNYIFRPQLFDLTEMYGAGNEPTTVAQFRQDFPNEMYEYSPVCWKKFRRLKYVTETKNLFNVNSDWDGILASLTDINLSVEGNTISGTHLGEGASSIISPTKIPISTNKVYYISGQCNGEPTILVRLTNESGEVLTTGASGIYNQYYKAFIVYLNNTFSITNDNAKYLQLGLRFGKGASTSTRVTFTNVQVEQGSTASPYQPYGYLPLNRGKYIANKEPVQLLDKSKYPATGTSNGITYTKNEDGSYNVNGTVTKNGLSTCLIGTAELVAGHIYLNNTVVVSGQKSYVECKFFRRDLQRWVFPGSRFLCGNYSAYAQITLLVNQTTGTVISDEKLCPELFDLTEMYGAGNEPTAEEFWATHSKNTMYDYNPYNAITFR